MKRQFLQLPLISMLLLFSTFSSAQLWTGVLATSRAINWSNVGAVAGSPGALPDATWGQCTTTACKTLCPGGTNPCGSGGTITLTSINNAISAAPAQSYVLIPPTGTSSSPTTINGTIQLANQVVLRGSGANSTFLGFTGNGNGCAGIYAAFCIGGDTNYPNGGEQNHGTWTAGFARSATSITMSNSLNITAGSTIIALDQLDQTSDNGQLFICSGTACGGTSSGIPRQDNTCASGTCTQIQHVMVTACSPSCNNSGSTVLTISPGLYMPNWSGSDGTGAYWATGSQQGFQQGIEDLSADLTNVAAGTNTVVIMNAYHSWVSGIRSMYPGTCCHVYIYGSAQNTVMSNYFYEGSSHNTQSYGVTLYGGSDNLVMNNIFQQVTDSTPSNSGGGGGNVGAYNFATMDIFFNGGGGWFEQSDYEHAGGNSFFLREGNEALGQVGDNIHGTHDFTTDFRNRYPGWQYLGCQTGSGTDTSSAFPPNQACDSNSSALKFQAGARYYNVVGNVLGQANYHTNYEALGLASNQNSSVIYLGGNGGSGSGTGRFCANPACTSTVTTHDPLAETSSMFWGNWDSVTAGCGSTLACSTTTVRWCTANATPIAACTQDERADTFGDTTGTPSTYAGLAITTETLSNSFFLTANTTSGCGTGLSWWKNPTTGTCEPFPPIGPDVTNGDEGICSGGTYPNSYNIASAKLPCSTGGGSLVAAWGGHANANPAMVCYLAVMGGPPDGSGGVLTFNRTSCYGNDSSGGDPPPAPTGLAAVVN